MVKKARIYKTVRTGDYYFIEKVGAYGHVMSSNYNSKSIGCEILVRKKEYFKIKKRIEIEDFLKFEKIASWLKKK